MFSIETTFLYFQGVRSRITAVENAKKNTGERTETSARKYSSVDLFEFVDLMLGNVYCC